MRWPSCGPVSNEKRPGTILSKFAQRGILMKPKKMGINRFVSQVLRAKRRNSRWSWGAVDRVTTWVFLQLWDDHFKTIRGAKHIAVGWDNPSHNSPGLNERHAHLTLIKNGEKGFGVVCTRRTPDRQQRGEIADFKKAFVLRLGPMTKKDGCTYARINGRIPIAEIVQERKRHAKRKKPK